MQTGRESCFARRFVGKDKETKEEKKDMAGRLADMINHDEIKLDQFFVMHPFSASFKRIYEDALSEIDYFDTLYIRTNKTYERLATVCNTINNIGKSIVVVTGYRGCGKTNFLQLIKHVANKKVKLGKLKDAKQVELHYAGEDKELRGKIEEEYRKAREEIRNIFFEQMYGMDDEMMDDEFIKYIEKYLAGKYQYINFDEGGMERDRPFSQKLFYMMRGKIKKYKKSEKLSQIVTIIHDFVTRNQCVIEENFEELDFKRLKEFWHKTKNIFDRLKDDDSYDEFLEEMKKLFLEQILFVYTIWEYAEMIASNCVKENRKLIYMLDNIDIIADGTTDIFKNTMMGIWKYMWDMRNVFLKIKENHLKEDEDFIELYNKTNFIISMRETTAMHISDHLRDRLSEMIVHFDMSLDNNEIAIMQRKIDLALSMIREGEIRSKGFTEAIYCLDELNGDRIFMQNLFQLFNNDYRTAVRCVIALCVKHMDTMKKAIGVIKVNKFGGRGMIYRLLIDEFFDWNYFDGLGIPSLKTKGYTLTLSSNHGYSCARVLLTILCNKQAKEPKHFFVNPEESVKLVDLYHMINRLMNLDEFVAIIDGMYSLRDKQFWNHLITFDNILFYSADAIKRHIQLNESNELSDSNEFQEKRYDIYLRATSAGHLFADIISIHFEYFSSRFAAASKDRPLFLLDNLEDKGQILAMKKIVKDVFAAVNRCVNSLEDYNGKVMEIRNADHYESIVTSPYYYEKQFHEERIIHNHITYLDEYRNFLIHIHPDAEQLREINDFLVEMIEKYLNLLKYDLNTGYRGYRRLFFSDNSARLYNELMVCIEKIRDSSDIRNEILISRDYYKKYYDGEECTFMKTHKGIL